MNCRALATANPYVDPRVLTSLSADSGGKRAFSNVRAMGAAQSRDTEEEPEEPERFDVFVRAPPLPPLSHSAHVVRGFLCAARPGRVRPNGRRMGC